MQGQERIRKLRWLCRRGMKELDLMLEGFLARNMDALSEGAFPALERLLAEEDDRLWTWLQRGACPGDPSYQELIEQIRRAP